MMHETKAINVRHNLKRIEVDDFGNIAAIEFHECRVFLDEDYATALRDFIRYFNQKPTPTMKANGVQSDE